MAQVFTQIFNMSVSASYIVLAVLLLRLFLKKAPRWVSLLLWGMVGVRLVFPFTFESLLSLIPSLGQIRQAQPGYAHISDLSYLNAAILQVNQQAFPTSESVGLDRWLPIFGWLWLVGIAVLLTYCIVSYLKLRRSLETAVRLDDGIYQSEKVSDPFVLGFVKPRIYLPFGMEEKTQVHVIAHEQSHIRRLDHIWKPLGFVILAVHWFNPLMWLSYVLFCRDIEFACDEKVIQFLDRTARADYSQALLSCSVSKPRITACPLAFGEVGVKSRIKSVISYKKPVFWVALVAVLLCLAAGVCFFTEPLQTENIGVRKVSVRKISDDQIELVIKHYGCYGKYSVEQFDREDPEYTSNGLIPYDGALGQNRIFVSFGDDNPTVSLAKQLNFGQITELTDSPVRILTNVTYPGDHGFAIYFGLDENIQVEETRGDLQEGGGTIRIPIKIVP